VRVPVLSENDAVLSPAEHLRFDMDNAAHLMRRKHTGDLVVVEDDEDSSLALERMSVHGVRRMPVAGHGGKLVGIVTVHDMLKRLGQEVNVITEIVSREQSREERGRR
jgi:CBS domain-containing protein